MRWQGRRGSENVEDRRGAGGRVMVGGGLGFVVLVVAVILLGGNPQALLSGLPQQPGGGLGAPGAPMSAAEQERAEFVSVVLADTEEVWGSLFREQGAVYVEPILVLFRSSVDSACGYASAASGPFYCSQDSKLYIDLSFFDELSRRFGAPGDFAQAYVIAHEVGHHVQHLQGLTERVHAQHGRVSEAAYNDLSVRLELQADFLAGVWAHHAQEMFGILEVGDIEEALRAASAIGDDRIQKQTQGYVVPDSFTHGTSAQRMKWFKLGFETGDMSRGDTFSVASP